MRTGGQAVAKQDFIAGSYGDIRFDEIFSSDMDQLKELMSNSQSSTAP